MPLDAENDVQQETEEPFEVEVEELEEDTQLIPEEVKKQLYLNSKTKGALDALQEKVVSRKLLVFLTATGLLIGAGLDPDTWGMIAMFYIGGQSAIDAVQVWRHGKQ